MKVENSKIVSEFLGLCRNFCGDKTRVYRTKKFQTP